MRAVSQARPMPHEKASRLAYTSHGEGTPALQTAFCHNRKRSLWLWPTERVLPTWALWSEMVYYFPHAPLTMLTRSSGRGKGIVIATGTDTEFGVIFSMMQDVEEKRTPLQLSMDELAKNLSIASFGIIGIICLIGVLQKRSWLEMFTIGGVFQKFHFDDVRC